MGKPTLPSGVDAATAARLRQELADARRPLPELSFLDRIAALERAVDAILTALEVAR
jgi:hypothetical protein